MIDLLKGVRILDLTTVVLGPYATHILADLGADVIKVEPPGGDMFRFADAGKSPPMGPAFMNCNRNKRSIVLDLGRPEGQAALQGLARTSDVFVHNMRPGAAGKLGIAFEDIALVKHDIVYCYACGFGQGGRFANDPAYDDTIQALSGLASLNACQGDDPRYVPSAVCDKIGGLHFAIAILAGIARRNRTRRAVCIETPMYESVVSFLMLELMGGHTFDPPTGGFGYQRLSTPFRRPYRTRDGFVSILPYTSRHWKRFLQLTGRSDMLEDGRFADAVWRRDNIELLYRMIAEVAPTRTTGEWLERLRELDIPCAMVNQLEDLLEEPHLSDVTMFAGVAHPSEGRLMSVRSPFRAIAGAECEDDRQAAKLGEHGLELLREAGFSDREIQTAVEAGGVCLPA